MTANDMSELVQINPIYVYIGAFKNQQNMLDALSRSATVLKRIIHPLIYYYHTP